MSDITCAKCFSAFWETATGLVCADCGEPVDPKIISEHAFPFNPLLPAPRFGGRR